MIPSSSLRAWTGSSAGVSLVEVMVAVAVFTVGAVAVGQTVSLAARGSASNEARVVAAGLATKTIERVRSLAVAAVPDGDTTTPVTVDGQTYSVRLRVHRDTDSGTGNACDGTSGMAGFRRVSVEVAWPQMSGLRPVVSDTIQALPVGAGNVDGGVLTVGVQDSSGAPVRGVPMTLQPSGTAATSGLDGCAVFTQLPAGSDYSVVADVSGWSDPAGRQKVVRGPFVVNAGGVTKDPGFQYDRTGSLLVTLPTPPGYAFPASPGLLLGNSGFDGGLQSYPECGSLPCATGPAAGPLRVEHLYPAPEGYTVWPGICSDAGEAASSAAAVPPGGSAEAVAATAAGVSVQLGPEVGGAVVWAVHAPDAYCPQGQVFALGAASPGGAVHAALPAGTWQFVVADTAAAARAGTGPSATLQAGEVQWISLSP